MERFINKPLTERRKNYLKATFVIISVCLSTIYIYTYIISSPLYSSEYSSINITYEDEPNYDNYIDCKFELDSKDESYNIPILNSRIKIRGTGTGWNRFVPKKGYRLELSEPKSLLGMREDDDWLLMAMYSDYPRMRIKLSLELWRDLEPTNPTAILPRSKYFRLFINGEFQGLYLLVERNDRRLFELDDPKNNIETSLIFQAKGYTEFREYEPIKWTQDWPNVYEDYHVMDDILGNLIYFVANSSDEEFFNPESGVYSKFDKLNLIDFYIFNFFILHGDFWANNYFIVRNTYPSKFYLVPWDFDNSFGQMAWNDFDADRNKESQILQQNYLFNRLLGNDEFRQDCQNRWIDLRQNVWSEESILNILSDIYNKIKNILDIEIEMWNPGDMRKEWNNDIDASISDLYEWIPDRLDFCDGYFIGFV